MGLGAALERGKAIGGSLRELGGGTSFVSLLYMLQVDGRGRLQLELALRNGGGFSYEASPKTQAGALYKKKKNLKTSIYEFNTLLLGIRHGGWVQKETATNNSNGS